MAACQAVLGTYELLEKIIVNVPPQTIQKAKTVSKAWHTLIKESKAIGRAAVLGPLKHQSKYADYAQAFGLCGVPVYGKEMKINLHPNLCPYPKAVVASPKSVEGELSAKFDLRSRVWDGVAKRAGDFATKPPCCAIGIFAAGFEGTVRCIVYVRDGVRLRDLLEVSTALAVQVPGIRKASGRIGAHKIAGYYKN